MGKYVNKESLTQALSINLNLSKKDAIIILLFIKSRNNY